ncbi:MAG: hypothetical protein V3R91_00565 [Myxococcota bacterium]
MSDTHQLDAARVRSFVLERRASARSDASIVRDAELSPDALMALRTVRPPRAVRVRGTDRPEQVIPILAGPGARAALPRVSDPRAADGHPLSAQADGLSDPRRYAALAEGTAVTVLQCAGPWRLFGEWWGESRFARDYYDVELSDGGVYRLYQNMEDRSWYIDGIYD